MGAIRREEDDELLIGLASLQLDGSSTIALKMDSNTDRPRFKVTPSLTWSAARKARHQLEVQETPPLTAPTPTLPSETALPPETTPAIPPSSTEEKGNDSPMPDVESPMEVDDSTANDDQQHTGRGHSERL